MNNKYKRITQLCMVMITTASMAVQVNQKGLGEVLIYPYYTVNNNLNTLYSVVNTTPDTKALAVHFLEGDINKEVLSFNVYLSAYDVWTGVLVPSVSTLAGHVGEPSVVHVTSDTSCAPFLNKAGQEFLPFVIDTDLDSDNRSLERAREGFIEIIELATFNNTTVRDADHGGIGFPRDCGAIQSDWANDGIYNAHADEQAPTAGLLGSATIVNVAEGLAFSFDAIALQNFWQGAGMHTDPGSLEPDLNAAFPQSKVLLASGELAVSEWSAGFEAVSAVLMRAEVYNEFGYDLIANGKSEWVMTFPTKRFHTDTDVEGTVLAPFSDIWDGSRACDSFTMDIWNREEQFHTVPVECVGSPCPPVDNRPELCYSSNVIEFLADDDIPTDFSAVLGSDNRLTVSGIDLLNAPENGWASIDFLTDQRTMTPLSGTAFKGLPVTGFAVQQFTNAGAGLGLLAQYGNLFKHKGLVVTDEELVD